MNPKTYKNKTGRGPGSGTSVRPSGISQSKNGKFVYLVCTISGLKSFADAARLKVFVKKYGSEENVLKNFACKRAEQYVKLGYSSEDIRKMVSKNKLPKVGKVADKVTKPDILKRKKRPGKSLSSFAIGDSGETIQVVAGSAIVEKAVKVYPWTGNPDYFRTVGDMGVIDIAEVSKETCLFPSRNLDNLCRGCHIYDQCNCSAKCGESDWKKGSKRDEVVVKKLASFTKEEIEAESSV